MISDDTTSARRAADPAQRHARGTTTLALVSLACVVVGALAWAPWQLRWNPDLSITLPTNEASEPPPPPPTELVEQQQNSSDIVLWVMILLGLVVLALLVAVAARAVRTWWSRRPRPVPEAPMTVDTMPGQVVPSREVVADAVAEALERLDGVPDPAEAVVQAWLVLEEAVAREGVVRQPVQTQAELTSDVLRATRAPSTTTTSLLRTYEAVRYGSGGATADDVAAARAALGSILGALRDEHPEVGP